MKERQKSLERALEEAVSRALRDNLAPLQRTADELPPLLKRILQEYSATGMPPAYLPKTPPSQNGEAS